MILQELKDSQTEIPTVPNQNSETFRRTEGGNKRSQNRLGQSGRETEIENRDMHFTKVLIHTVCYKHKEN